MRFHLHAWLEGDLARANVRDTVHCGEAVRTVAGEAEAPTASRMTSFAQQLGEEGIG